MGGTWSVRGRDALKDCGFWNTSKTCTADNLFFGSGSNMPSISSETLLEYLASISLSLFLTSK